MCLESSAESWLFAIDYEEMMNVSFLLDPSFSCASRRLSGSGFMVSFVVGLEYPLEMSNVEQISDPYKLFEI